MAARTCPKHPDKETYISCQRCGRPICPDCMRPASVGFQCPECVAEGRRTQRQPRTAFGGRIHARDTAVSIAIIAVNVVVFLIITAGGTFGNRLFADWVMISGEVPLGGVPPDAGVANGEWWRLLSSSFVHAQIWHIGLNMLGVVVIGMHVERLLGRWRYLVLYLFSCLAAGVAVYWLAPANAVTFGASGGVFGLLGAGIILFRKRGYDISTLLVLLAINVVFTFTAGGISWQGHLGGLVGGLVGAAAFAYAPAKVRTVVQAAVYVVLVLVCVALVAARTADLGGTFVS